MQLLKDLFRKKTVGGICLLILIFFLVLAIFADVIAPTPMVNGSLPINLADMRIPPSPTLSIFWVPTPWVRTYSAT